MQLPFEAVENITKPLASVSKMLDANHAVVYHPNGSAIYNLCESNNKELKDILGGVIGNKKYNCIPLKRENDVFNFELLVDVAASKGANAESADREAQGFPRQR